jgi:hypothetical protein
MVIKMTTNPFTDPLIHSLVFNRNPIVNIENDSKTITYHDPLHRFIIVITPLSRELITPHEGRFRLDYSNDKITVYHLSDSRTVVIDAAVMFQVLARYRIRFTSDYDFIILPSMSPASEGPLIISLVNRTTSHPEDVLIGVSPRDIRIATSLIYQVNRNVITVVYPDTTIVKVEPFNGYQGAFTVNNFRIVVDHNWNIERLFVTSNEMKFVVRPMGNNDPGMGDYRIVRYGTSFQLGTISYDQLVQIVSTQSPTSIANDLVHHYGQMYQNYHNQELPILDPLASRLSYPSLTVINKKYPPIELDNTYDENDEELTLQKRSLIDDDWLMGSRKRIRNE